jgi:hypothetical protein
MENNREVEPVKEKAYIPGLRYSKRFRPIVNDESSPKRKRRGTRGSEGGSTAKKTGESKETD